MINTSFKTIETTEAAKSIATTQAMTQAMELIDTTDSRPVTELDIIQLVHRMYGGVSTTIARELCQMLGIVPALPFELHSYKISTQTMILELQNVRFNDFLINVQTMGKNLELLMRDGSGIVPPTLLSIKAKKFEIEFDHPAKKVKTSQFYCSQLNEMNSSMEFKFVACKKDGKVRRGQAKELGKIYVLRLFRNGMLQMPGVDELFEMSEACVVVQQMIKLYESLFDMSYKINVINRMIAMVNYVAPMNLPINARLDLSSLVRCVKKNSADFDAKCQSVNLTCVSFELAAKRVVLYAKFVVDKEKSPFQQYNPLSTSNRKRIKTITLQITQRGIITIQGADSNFRKTKDFLERFQQAAPLIFNDYIAILPESPSKSKATPAKTK